jgi:hypothetical protein
MKNSALFHGQEVSGPKIKINATKQNVQQAANTNGGAYKKNAAAFFGEANVETESQGTNFQRNAAHFMGMATPTEGQRPFKIEKTIPGEPVHHKGAQDSYLN